MRTRKSCEVLVVGAGPVGLFTALRLAQNGVDVCVIDEGSGVTSQSYACGLHPRTLSLLQSVELDTQVLPWGRRIGAVVLYQDGERRGAIDLSRLAMPLPFLLVLPQSALEMILENRLKRENVRVMWNHRLSGLCSEEEEAIASVDELAGTVTGYDVPRWETVVSKSFEISARYIVGADGYYSAVRRFANIDSRLLSKPEVFVVYEFDSDVPEDELRIVLNETDTNVMWPLPDRRCRWSFEWTETTDGAFPTKERNGLWFEEAPIAQRTRLHLQRFLETRAPWFKGTVEDMDWAADVQFEHRLANQFGHTHYWLAGDAAHQTGPVGMQSMNVGMREAEMLAGLLATVLRESGSNEALDEYGRIFHAEWERLLGISSIIEPHDPTAPPLVNNMKALLACLPGSADDLQPMLEQLGFDLRLQNKTNKLVQAC